MKSISPTIQFGTSHAGLVVKNPPANEGDIRDMGLIPRSGKSPGGGNGSPLQYSCLENSLDRGAWWATVQRVAKSRTQLNDCPRTSGWVRRGVAGEGRRRREGTGLGWRSSGRRQRFPRPGPPQAGLRDVAGLGCGPTGLIWFFWL